MDGQVRCEVDNARDYTLAISTHGDMVGWEGRVFGQSQKLRIFRALCQAEIDEI